jgi:peptide/nickel transport system permease protein
VTATGTEAAASRGQLVFQRFVRQRRAIAGLVAVLLLMASAYISPHVVEWQYNELDVNSFLSPPTRAHWFGTTQNACSRSRCAACRSRSSSA